MVNWQDINNSVTRDYMTVKGDSIVFNFQLSGLGSRAEYEALNVNFEVAEHYDDTPVINIDKTNGITLAEYDANDDVATFAVGVAPTYTANLDISRYFYDLQISDEANVITLLRGKLTVINGVD